MALSEFLQLSSPQDMWHKATRELLRFKERPCVDHAYNFFVTVYHIRDYAKAAGLDVTVLDNDPDFQLCRLAANSGKHLNLTGLSCTAASDRGFETHTDLAYQDDEEHAVIADGDRIPILELGQRVLTRLGSWLGIV